MSETRLPDEMPTEWRIASFSHEKGFGTLAHETGEHVIFNIDAWDLGDWKPPRKELHFAAQLDPSMPAASRPGHALLPKEGEPVRVRWKRSISGKNVPSLVQPTARVSSNRKEYKLGAWLKGIQKHAGQFLDLTSKDLLKTLAKLDADKAEEWRDGEPRDGSDFVFLLMDLANAAEVDPEWAKAHGAWIYSDDHRWDRERAQRTLATILGLQAPVPTSGDGAKTEPEESLPDYVARCNALAQTEGRSSRLREVTLDGDAHVFIAVTDSAFDALVNGGYVIVD